MLIEHLEPADFKQLCGSLTEEPCVKTLRLFLNTLLVPLLGNSLAFTRIAPESLCHIPAEVQAEVLVKNQMLTDPIFDDILPF